MKYYKCAITGKEGLNSVWGIHLHHYVKDQQYNKNPEWFIDNGIEQRLIPLWFTVHDCIHHRSEKTFMKEYGDKYGVKRLDFLWNRKEWLNEQF